MVLVATLSTLGSQHTTTTEARQPRHIVITEVQWHLYCYGIISHSIKALASAIRRNTNTRQPDGLSTRLSDQTTSSKYPPAPMIADDSVTI